MSSPSTETTLLGFKRYLTDAARKEAYETLRRQGLWLLTRSKKPNDAKPAWDKIFDAGKWRCVYCGTNLAASTDIIASTTEEHLVPRTLVESIRHQPNLGPNLAPCCSSCNALKSDYVPPLDSPAWKKRTKYIELCRQFIARRRLQNFKEYLPHLVRHLAREAGLDVEAVKVQITLPQ